MKRIAWCLSLVALTGAGTLAVAQGAHHPKKPHPPLERSLDVNGDGVIDAAEIANAPAALKTLDANGDGRLTPEEYRPPRPPEEERDVPGEAPAKRRQP